MTPEVAGSGAPAGRSGSRWIDPDSEDMAAATAGQDAQIRTSLSSYKPLEGLGDPARLRAVAVAGMGGSAVAGEVLQAFAAPRSAVPVVLLNDGSAPKFLGRDTLVFAVSLSGNTEETLATAAAALASGAPLVAVSGGGELETLAADAGAPHIRITPGVRQSRAAAASSVTQLLLVCEQLGLLSGARQQLGLAAVQLGKRRAELEGGSGIAAEVARQIGRTIPIFHGLSGLAAVAARRWKTQVNENGKAPAFFAVQPEACHNEICGFGQNGDVTRQILTLVNLRTGFEPAGMNRRIELFEEVTTEALARVIHIEGQGEGELARFFDLVMIGDFVSLHVAAREGIDPGPVPAISELKEHLEAGG